MTNKVRKLRSKVYDKVIEVNLPITFYWVRENGNLEFDGLGFLVEDCSKWETKLVGEVLEELYHIQSDSRIVKYLSENYEDIFNTIVKKIVSDDIGVPEEILEAFGEIE